ncbi:MAG: trypsin-like peptidase domain-containing protein [Oligoflexia bacterium]|nr:trypsin-like peptidase domain-containing protein [Oligoflexia bacterium]
MKFHRAFAVSLALAAAGASFTTMYFTPPHRHEHALAFHDIAKQALPAVVSISSVKREGLFDFDRRAIGIGSGMIVRPDGVILTNSHVVEDAEKITVTLGDGEKYKRSAHVVGIDPNTDLAVIQIDRKPSDLKHPFQTVVFGSSKDIEVGDPTLAIGSPFGLSRTVTSGIVSAKSRGEMGILDVEDFIQTDAPINPGNSGGPLLNSNGEVIGVNTAIFSQGGTSTGIGFAIPAEIARSVYRQILAQGYVSRGWVGLAAQDVDAQLAQYFKVPRSSSQSNGEDEEASQGALISNVVPNGPAGRAKIQVGDVILKYDGKPVSTARELKTRVGNTPAGKDVSLSVLHEGRVSDVQVSILQQPGTGPRSIPPPQMAGQVPGAAGTRSVHHAPHLGLTVEDIPPEIALFLRLGADGQNAQNPAGAIVTDVEPGSAAFDSGLAPGDIILKVNQTDVRNAREFRKVASGSKEGDLSVLYVQRGPKERIFVPVKNLG